jgi:hypothetical protein
MRQSFFVDEELTIDADQVVAWNLEQVPPRPRRPEILELLATSRWPVSPLPDEDSGVQVNLTMKDGSHPVVVEPRASSLMYWLKSLSIPESRGD